MNTPISCHQRYQDQLQRIVQNDWRIKVINAFAEYWPEWDATTSWQKCFGRFEPDCEPYMTILLQQSNCSVHMCLIEVFKLKPEAQFGAQQYYEKELGWLRGRRFPDDPKLRYLSAVLETQHEITVLRYRPYKRCTFSVTSQQFSGRIFGKQFSDNRGAQLFAESQRLWNAACEGHLNFKVAQPIRWDIKTQTLWQHAIEGKPLVKQLFCADGIAVAARIGQATASMPNSGIRPALRFDGQAQMQRSNKYAQELSRRLPDLSVALTDLLQTLLTLHASHCTASNHKPLHGAPHAHQWLDCGESLGLVDFDRICLGDPELDAATFIAEMDFEDRKTVPVDELNGAFLEAYQHTAGKLNLYLLQAYRAHKRLAKALKAARALHVNGDRKARQHVAYAHQALKEAQA
jgi:hypothetical protein